MCLPLLVGSAVALLAQVEVEINPAELIELPVAVDSNTPVLRNGAALTLYHGTGNPLVSGFDTALQYSGTDAVIVDGRDRLPMWIESLWQAGDGTLYAWYHHERFDACPGTGMTVPEIGALLSRDGGRSFRDLGIVLRSGEAVDCTAANGYFAGGNGDFSVIADREGRFLYFLFTAYAGALDQQGVAAARIDVSDVRTPLGKVWKYYQGAWTEPGLGGRVTPIFPVRTAWQTAETDSFWGPSVHWNREIGQYVMLLNRACCEPGWPQEGIYISVASSLEDPASWQEPMKILDGGDWYPWVLGSSPDDTSSEAGERVRLFTRSSSEWELTFR